MARHSIDAQQAALRAAGAEHFYAEKISGARSDRPQLAKMIKALGEGDTLVVTCLDRLARSTRRALEQCHDLADEIGRWHGIWIFSLKSPGEFRLSIGRRDLQHFHRGVAQLISK